MIETEPQIDPAKIYEGLDAQHTPRLFVPERYVEKGSGKLQRLAAYALLAAQMIPDTQFDVVWLGSRPTASLRAVTQATGTFGHSFGHPVDGTEDHFLVDPFIVEQWPNGRFTYVGRIEEALKNGAGVFKPADL